MRCHTKRANHLQGKGWPRIVDKFHQAITLIKELKDLLYLCGGWHTRVFADNDGCFMSQTDGRIKDAAADQGNDHGDGWWWRHIDILVGQGKCFGRDALAKHLNGSKQDSQFHKVRATKKMTSNV